VTSTEFDRTDATVAPLSFAQERLWLIDQAAPGSPTYNIPLLMRWSGPLDLPALRTALDELVRRHDVLRTTYEMRGERVVQVVGERHEVAVDVVDGLPWAEVRTDALQRSRMRFDLAADLPMRCVVWRGGPDGDAILLVFHHIAADGWSLAPFFEELAEVYRATVAGRATELAPVGSRYVDYAVWDRRLLEDPTVRERLARRAEVLVEVPVPLRLGGARPITVAMEGTRPGTQVLLPVSEDVVSAAGDLARQTRTTPSVVFLAAYVDALRRWAGREEFLVGTVTVNRPHSALERMVGFFVNTVPLRCRCDDSWTFRDLLTATRPEAFAALTLQRLPLGQLTAAVAARNPRGHQALVDATFAYQNFPTAQVTAAPWSPYELLPTGAAKSDVLLMVDTAVDQSVRCTFELATDRYPEELCARFAADYLAILTAAVAEPDRLLDSLSIPHGPTVAPVLETGHARRVRGDRAAPEFERRAIELFCDALSTVDGLMVGELRAEDSLFGLGGHSLLAVTMLARAGTRYGVAIAPRDFLADPTVAGLARLLSGAGRTAAERRPDAASADGDFPAGSAQRRMWLLDRMPHLRSSYLVASVIEFAGVIDVDRLAGATDTVLARHPALRSRFRLDRATRQLVYRTDGEPARTATTDSSLWRSDTLAERVSVLCQTPFDLATDAPARAEILAREDGCLLVLCAHHLVLDGASLQLLFDQIAVAYRGDRLPDAVHPAHVPRMGDDRESASALAAVLADAPTDIALPYDRPRCRVQPTAAATVSGRLNADRTARLRRVAAEAGCSLFLTTVTLAAAALSRHGGQRDFLFAFPWSDRSDPVAADAVGMFVNSVPIRADLRGDPTWQEALDRVVAASKVSYRYADAPFDDVAAALHPDRDLSRPPVTPVWVATFDQPLRPPDLGVPACLRPQPADAKFELEFSAAGIDGELEFTVSYLTDLFDPATAEAVLDTLLTSATELTDDPMSLIEKENR
jgi:non-ribosomal peptide synthetase component F